MRDSAMTGGCIQAPAATIAEGTAQLTINYRLPHEHAFMETGWFKLDPLLRPFLPAVDFLVAVRAQLEAALELVREGDVLVVTKLDRLEKAVECRSNRL